MLNITPVNHWESFRLANLSNIASLEDENRRVKILDGVGPAGALEYFVTGCRGQRVTFNLDALCGTETQVRVVIRILDENLNVINEANGQQSYEVPITDPLRWQPVSLSIDVTHPDARSVRLRVQKLPGTGDQEVSARNLSIIAQASYESGGSGFMGSTLGDNDEGVMQLPNGWAEYWKNIEVDLSVSSSQLLVIPSEYGRFEPGTVSAGWSIPASQSGILGVSDALSSLFLRVDSNGRNSTTKIEFLISNPVPDETRVLRVWVKGFNHRTLG